MRKSCVKAVVGLLGRAGITFGGVGSIGCLYQSSQVVLREFFHSQIAKFSSVKAGVSHNFHKTYNNKRLSIFNLLVINS
jgi:hypothetical protein